MTVLILVIIAILFLIDVIVFSYDRYDWSIGIMVATIVGAYFFTPYIKDFIHSAGWVAITTKYIPGYLAAGLATALLKWLAFSFRHIGTIKKIKAWFDAAVSKDPNFVKKTLDPYDNNRNGTKDIELTEGHTRMAFVEYFKSKLEHDSPSRKHIYTEGVDFNKPTAIVDALTPRAKENVGIISIWVFQWPIVIVSLLLSDLLLKITRTIATALDALFSAVSRKLVAGATKGL